MKKALPLFVLLFQILNLSAATITWNGTNGNWNNASKWIGGVIPSATDEVHIPTGAVLIPAGYLAAAKMVSIAAAGHLTIRQGGSLATGDASGMYGINNEGTVLVQGNLDILDLAPWNSYGIRSLDTFWVAPTGLVTMNHAGDYGFWNEGYVHNNGAVHIQGKRDAIHEAGASATWFNTVNASLTIQHSRLSGIYVDTNAVFINRGWIRISETDFYGIWNFGSFVNEQPGQIECSETDIDAINLYGTFENKSQITLTDNSRGMRVGAGITEQGTFLNQNEGRIDISGGGSGIYMDPLADDFHNWGLITITGLSMGIQSYGGFFWNETCGRIETDSWTNINGGLVYNYGWIKNTSSSYTTDFGVFLNYGVIEDNPLTMSGAVTNHRLIVAPVPGPLVENVAVSNFLNVASWNQHVALGVFADAAATVSAGTFSQNSNTFTPSAAGAGLSAVYIKIRRTGGGCTEIFRIDVLPPAPLAPPPGAGFSFSQAVSDESFLLYPNPTNGPLMLQPGAAHGWHEIQLLDVAGKMLLRRELELTSGRPMPLDLPQGLLPGLYFIRLLQSGHPVWQEKLVVE